MKQRNHSFMLSVLMSMAVTNAFAGSIADTGDADDQPKGAIVIATTQGNTDTSTAFNTENTWVNTHEYEMTVDPVNNPKLVVKGMARNVSLDYFRFNWNGDDPTAQTVFSGTSATLPAGFLREEWKRMTITPLNIENMVDGETYEFILTSYEVLPYARVPRIRHHILLKKVMPTEAKTLTFRPKQEVEDGSGKVIAYMIPNKEYTDAFPYRPWAAPGQPRAFAYHQTKTEMEACYDARDEKANNGFKNLSNIFYNLSKNGQNGYDGNPEVYDENEWDKTFEFVFGTSLHKGDEVVDLVDAKGKGVTYEHPVGYDTNQKYMLNVDASFIDGETWHEVKPATIYPGVSTRMKANGDVECFNEDYRVESNQTFQFQYACWHHANTVAWASADKQHKLQWSHEGLNQSYDFKDIVSKNTYDPIFFGNGSAGDMTLLGLTDRRFLDIYSYTIELNTEPDGSGQVNPYFVPNINIETKKIEYVQRYTQIEAAPIANHTEYLIITMKDAFNHDVPMVLDVRIISPNNTETGIDQLVMPSDKALQPDDVYYNLNGQRVDHPTPGLYIHHGHKVVIK